LGSASWQTGQRSTTRPSKVTALLTLLALLLLLLAACGPTNNEPTTTLKPYPAAQYPHPEFLADTAWLAERVNDPFTRIIDLSPLEEYERGHLPGAIHVWWQDLIEVNNPTYGMLVDPASRKRVFEQAGIDNTITVVAYDNAGGRYAARFLWALLYGDYAAGRLLNGGIATWRAEGRAISRGVPTIQPTRLPNIPANEKILINGEDLLAGLGQNSLAVVDTRTLAEGRETWGSQLRFGRIPGARSIPWDRNLIQKNTAIVRDPSELARVYESQALGRDQRLVVYGLTGADAAHTFWMLRVLGYTNVRLYDGAWAEWGANRPGTPYQVEPLAVGTDPAPVAGAPIAGR
jgi:thiosulfate/3-mercaptopyruvate sulfurtransferase